MFDWLPAGTDVMRDVSPADWVLRALKPWAREGGVRLWSFMPDVFDAYARVFHPIREGVETTTWAELGSRRGISLTPDIAFLEIAGLDPRDQNGIDDLAPIDGNLPTPECEALTRILRPHTRSPETCWFCLWEGSGLFWSTGHAHFSAVDASESQRHGGEAAARKREAGREQDELLDSTPRVMAQARHHFLFKGPLEAACGFEPANWQLSPNLWWPDDRSWCVITEIEGFSTYVGGTAGAIADVVSASDVEAIEVPHDVHMDPGLYVPFWR
jgi:hypothetical protein